MSDQVDPYRRPGRPTHPPGFEAYGLVESNGRTFYGFKLTEDDEPRPCSAKFWSPYLGPCVGGDCVHNRDG